MTPEQIEVWDILKDKITVNAVDLINPQTKKLQCNIHGFMHLVQRSLIDQATKQGISLDLDNIDDTKIKITYMK